MIQRVTSTQRIVAPAQGGTARAGTVARAQQATARARSAAPRSGAEQKASLPSKAFVESMQAPVQQLEPYAEPFHVQVCGRQLEVQLGGGATLDGLKAAMQRDLQMEGQAFEVFDVQGRNLGTNGELTEALHQGRVPLAASLSEATIHFIENRREELSQMQWKLVRDQMAGLDERVMAMQQRVGDLLEQFTAQKRDWQGFQDRSWGQMEAHVENTKEAMAQSARTLGERIDAVSHLLHTERNMREASKQGMDRQTQGLREALDADRSARRAELAHLQSLVEDCNDRVLAEGRIRESFEQRHVHEVASLGERIDQVGSMISDSLQDLSVQIKNVSVHCDQGLQEHARSVLTFRAESEDARVSAAARMQITDDRSSTFEQRLAELKSRQEVNFDELWAKTERLGATVEDVRREERGKSLALRSVLGRVDELEEALKLEEKEKTRRLREALPSAQAYGQKEAQPSAPQVRQVAAPSPPEVPRRLVTGAARSFSPETARLMPTGSVRSVSPEPSVVASVRQRPPPAVARSPSAPTPLDPPQLGMTPPQLLMSPHSQAGPAGVRMLQVAPAPTSVNLWPPAPSQAEAMPGVLPMRAL